MSLDSSAYENDITWPDWMDRSWSDIHTAIENELIRAYISCEESADAACMNWTREGLISVSASNIMSWMKHHGMAAPNVPPTERLPWPTYEADRYEDWALQDAEDQWYEIANLFGWEYG